MARFVAEDVTELLKRLTSGDRSAMDKLIPLVYQELHRIAEGYLRRESPGHTLQPTSLVHEAYLRMVKQPHPEYSNRAHFYGIAARVMRQVLVDHARSRQAAKRGAGKKLPLCDNVSLADRQPMGLLVLDEALSRLSRIDENKARLVEMRFFGGLTSEEFAEVLGVSPLTVKRKWAIAKAWLYHDMKQAGIAE